MVKSLNLEDVLLTPKLFQPIFCLFFKFEQPILIRVLTKFLKPLILIDLFIMNMRI